MGQQLLRTTDDPDDDRLEFSDDIDDLDDEQRAELHAALERALAHRGVTYAAIDVITELQETTRRWVAEHR